MAKGQGESKWPARPPMTGLRLPPELVVKMKHYCIDSQQTMGEYVTALLRADLGRRGYLSDKPKEK